MEEIVETTSSNSFYDTGTTSKPTFFKTSKNGEYFQYSLGFPNPLMSAGLKPQDVGKVRWTWDASHDP